MSSAAVDIPKSLTDATTPSAEVTDSDILQILQGYLSEGREGRAQGFEDRDSTWRRNQDAYWGRYDNTEKAKWQATEVMPHVHNSVERFGSAMRRALKQAGEWWTAKDPQDRSGLLTPMIESFTNFFLERSGTNTSGHYTNFNHTFGDIMKGGARKMICFSVTWNPKQNRVQIDPVDPSEVFLDPTNRRLFRIRETEIDLHVLMQKKDLKDSEGNPIYNLAALEDAIRGAGDARSASANFTSDKDRQSGGSRETLSTRKKIRIHEFLCDLVDRDGKLIAENQLVEMADERVLIRKPEPNPFWHGKDWIICVPMISVPWTTYGRTYVEGFASLAATFTELTNLVLDSTFITAMNAYMVWPEALADPTQLNDGMFPNKQYLADQDWPWDREFIRPVELGQVNPELFRIWAGIKNELMEASSENELGLGQLAPKSDVTATEIGAAERGGQAIHSNIAADVESTALNPMLEITYMTALQHADPAQDQELQQFLGEEWSAVLTQRRQEFRSRKFHMIANGLSGLIERAEQLRNMTGLLNIIGANETLAMAYQKEYSLPKTLGVLMRGNGVDTSQIKLDPNEQPIAPPPQPGGGGPGDLVSTGGGDGAAGAS